MLQVFCAVCNKNKWRLSNMFSETPSLIVTTPMIRPSTVFIIEPPARIHARAVHPLWELMLGLIKKLGLVVVSGIKRLHYVAKLNMQTHHVESGRKECELSPLKTTQSYSGRGIFFISMSPFLPMNK